MTLLEKYWSKIVVRKSTGCWIWVGALDHNGRARERRVRQ
jgi:hypothetical protein